MEQIERRVFPLDEMRAADGDGGNKIVGHAAVFDSLSEELWGFHEKIAPGAFKRTLKKADVRALFNHDPNYVLGRSKSSTLKLAEDDQGLAIEVDPPDTQWARDLLVSMRRGDITQMSFGFRAIKERWEGTLDNPIRVLEEVELFDVSPVTFPAYPETDVQVRSAILERGKQTLAGSPQGQRSAGEDEPAQGRRLDVLRKRIDLLEAS